MTDNTPPEDVIRLLNQVDQGYVGLTPINKPQVQFIDESEPDYSPRDEDWGEKGDK